MSRDIPHGTRDVGTGLRDSARGSREQYIYIVGKVNKANFKNEKVMNKTDFLLTRYKWEFLRRNKTYIRFYQDWEKIKKRKNLNHFEEMYEGKSQRISLATSIKFGTVGLPMDPGINLPDWERYSKAFMVQRKNPAQMTDNMRYDIAKVVWFVGFLNTQPLIFSTNEKLIFPTGADGMPQTYFNQNRKALEGRYLTVRIDLNAPSQKILKLIGEAVRRIKENRPKRQKRIRYELYDRYLRIYDLRESGKTYREIAGEVFPREFKEFSKTRRNKYDFAPLTEKVKSGFVSCKGLISGDYTKIR